MEPFSRKNKFCILNRIQCKIWDLIPRVWYTEHQHEIVCSYSQNSNWANWVINNKLYKTRFSKKKKKGFAQNRVWNPKGEHAGLHSVPRRAVVEEPHHTAIDLERRDVEDPSFQGVSPLMPCGCRTRPGGRSMEVFESSRELVVDCVLHHTHLVHEESLIVQDIRCRLFDAWCSNG